MSNAHKSKIMKQNLANLVTFVSIWISLYRDEIDKKKFSRILELIGELEQDTQNPLKLLLIRVLYKNYELRISHFN